MWNTNKTVKLVRWIAYEIPHILYSFKGSGGWEGGILSSNTLFSVTITQQISTKEPENNSSECRLYLLPLGCTTCVHYPAISLTYTFHIYQKENMILIPQGDDD